MQSKGLSRVFSNFVKFKNKIKLKKKERPYQKGRTLVFLKG